MTEQEPLLPDDHFITLHGLELAVDGRGRLTGYAPVRPEFFAPGTRRVRTGPLATLVDIVAGHTDDGPYGPTVDLRVESFAAAPSDGGIHLACTVLRVGARLIVGETLLRPQDEHHPPFARAMSTFVNTYVGPGFVPGPREVVAMDDDSFDAVLAARVLDDRTLALDPTERVDNGVTHTIQGGAQALLAELAAEHVFGGGAPMVAADLDIRFLRRLREGPLHATVLPFATVDGSYRADVALTDAGAGDRLVSHVALRMVPADAD